MEEVRFEQLGYLHGLWLVLGLVGVCAYGFARRRRAMRCFASEPLIAALTPEVSTPRRVVKAALTLIALVGLVLSLIDPRWGTYYEDVKHRGIDVVFALDVSRSMLAEDASPSRLERAKQYIRDVVEACGGDRVALVTFAGEASLHCPLTVDYSAFRMVLDEVGPRSGMRGGSLLGDAIRLATESFADEIKGSKAIIVLSDGEDMDSYPVEAARKAYEDRGIRTYAVGLGDSGQGGRIPVESGAGKTYLLYDGQEVWTRMNPAVLEQTALAGGGAYIPAGTSMVDMGRLYQDRIALADQREFESRQIERRHVQFNWFAVPALVLLLIETLLPERRPAAEWGAV